MISFQSFDEAAKWLGPRASGPCHVCVNGLEWLWTPKFCPVLGYFSLA